jgi:ribonuclease HII
VTLIAGLDEAGRGPVIGPLVIAGVLFRDDQLRLLRKLGVDDSKRLSPLRRRVLAKRIRDFSLKYKVLFIEPRKIDDTVLRGTRLRRLNWLEAKAMAKIITILAPDIAYVDAADVNPDRFGQHIRAQLKTEIKIISEHHADARYAVVGAASILAKVLRDDALTALRARYGDLGSGYSSDPQTRSFLRRCIKERRDLPYFVRTSWKTIERLRAEVE